MALGKTMLGRRHVLPSVLATLTSIQIEGTFPTGTYLVTVHHPVSSDDGDLEKALYGSFLPVPSKEAFALPDPAEYEPEKAPGAVIPVKEGKITLNQGRKRITLKVVSNGDRPIQVSGHLNLVLKGLLKHAAGWLPLPLRGNQSGAIFRSNQGLWLSPGSCRRNIRAF
jgi:urease